MQEYRRVEVEDPLEPGHVSGDARVVDGGQLGKDSILLASLLEKEDEGEGGRKEKEREVAGRREKAKRQGTNGRHDVQ